MHKVSLFNRLHEETDDRDSRMFRFTREIDKLIFDHQVRSQKIPVRIIMHELCTERLGGGKRGRNLFGLGRGGRNEL